MKKHLLADENKIIFFNVNRLPGCACMCVCVSLIESDPTISFISDFIHNQLVPVRTK